MYFGNIARLRAKFLDSRLRCSQNVALTILYIQQLQQPDKSRLVDVGAKTGIESCLDNGLLLLWECFCSQNVYRRAILMVILGRCHEQSSVLKLRFLKR